ncbi:MAG: cupin domain-containing protein [Halioglobus sp.]
MDAATNTIFTDFVVLSPDNAATVETADADLYARIEQRYSGFAAHQLVAAHEFDSDWDTWEVHPHGDEVVLLLSGEIEMVLKEAAGERSLHLAEPGAYVIVPRGVWHTARTHVKTRLLFITPGEGTLNQTHPG